EKRLGAEEGGLVEVGEAEEFGQGPLPGGLFIPGGFFELRVEEAIPEKSRPVLLYCAGGNRSALAARTLKELGYERVFSMAGGYGKWKDAGLPYVVPRAISPALKKRYDRHLLIPEVGEEGQLKLLD